MHRLHSTTFVISTLTLFMIAACAEDHAEHGAAADACEHIVEPGAAITAIADMAGDAPDISERHMRYDIDLSQLAGASGYVDLVIDQQAEYTMFLSDTVPVALQDSTGAYIEAVGSYDPVDECAEVRIGYTYPLGVGTYRMTLSPGDIDPAQEVQLVVVLEGEQLEGEQLDE